MRFPFHAARRVLRGVLRALSPGRLAMLAPILLALALTTDLGAAESQPRANKPAARRVSPASLASVVTNVRRSGDSSLSRRLEDLLSRAKLGSARVGISVVEIDSGREVASLISNPGGDATRDPDFTAPDLFIPASNLKLITSGAALLVLGPDFEFRTQLIRRGQTLVLKGGGDPGLADPALLTDMQQTLDDLLDRLAAGAVAAGVQRIDELITDDRVFDRELVHPDWPRDQLNRWYCAPVSGLNFHANVLRVFARPGAAGAAPDIRSEPSGPWLSIDTSPARTLRDGATSLWLAHGPTPLRFVLHGGIRAALEEPIEVTLPDPPQVFARALADRLRAKGVAGAMTVRAAAADEHLEPESPADVVAQVRTRMEVALARCNVDSSNLYAEALAKMTARQTTGQPGSWANGLAAVRMRLHEKLGPAIAKGLVLADGSGLSRNSRLSPTLLARWMAAVAREPSVGEIFVQSLPLAGQEGTVKSRFKNRPLTTQVRCKSGYIRQVRTLSGFATDTDSGRRLAFAILVNDVPPSADLNAKNFHEDTVAAIDRWLAENAGAAAKASPPVPGAGVGEHDGQGSDK